MEEIMFKKIFACSILALLSGCQSTPIQYTGYLTSKTNYPIRDSRFVDNSVNTEGSALTPIHFRNDRLITKSTNHTVISPMVITRCDETPKICKHGVMVAGIHISYDLKNISKREINISGVLYVDVKSRGSSSFFEEKLNMKSETGYISFSVDGYPLLPELSEEYRFEGRTGNGETVSIEGPYGLRYEFSVNLNDHL